MSRVVIVTPGTDGRRGGMERFSLLLCDALADEHEVIVMPTPAVSTRLSATGWLAESRALAPLVEAAAPDLVITGATVGAGFGRSIPRVHVCHGTMVSNARASVGEPWRARASAALGAGLAERLALRNAMLVAVSERTAADLRRDYLVHRRVTVIENGVDTRQFAPRDRDAARRRLGWDSTDRFALFVGRPEARKGIDLAVDAAQRAGVRLVVAGPRAVSGAEWLGLLTPDELAVAYAAADFTLFPTRYEACSYAILEAIACGARLLTTETGWMADAARRDGAVGSLLLPWTVDAFADALRRPARPSPTEEQARARLLQMVLEGNSLGAFTRQWRGLVDHALRESATAAA